MRTLKEEELRGYAAMDWAACDYQMWALDDLPYQFRGPRPRDLDNQSYIVAIGAAQTFGRFCERSYPALLGEKLGVPCLNMGFEGAGPRMFMRPKLLSLINNAALVIVQAMSGRSLSNSVFECPNDGGSLRRRNKGPLASPQFALDAWRDWMDELKTQYGMTQERRKLIQNLVEETRTLWVGEMALLRHAIKSPCILFWYSRRDLDYEERYSDPELVFGEFPHLIDARTFHSVSPLFQATVKCVTSRGSPQPLFNRFTGEPFCINPDFRKPYHSAYYPSPEMQEDAAGALEAPVRRMVADIRENQTISL